MRSHISVRWHPPFRPRRRGIEEPPVIDRPSDRAPRIGCKSGAKYPQQQLALYGDGLFGGSDGRRCPSTPPRQAGRCAQTGQQMFVAVPCTASVTCSISVERPMHGWQLRVRPVNPCPSHMRLFGYPELPCLLQETAPATFSPACQPPRTLRLAQIVCFAHAGPLSLERSRRDDDTVAASARRTDRAILS